MPYYCEKLKTTENLKVFLEDIFIPIKVVFFFEQELVQSLIKGITATFRNRIEVQYFF